MVVKSVIYFLLIKKSVAKLIFCRRKAVIFCYFYVDWVKGGEKIYTWALPDNTF